MFLVKGPGDYWLFGLYRNGKGEVRKTGIQEHGGGFKAAPATLAGFDVPLLTTPFPRQYDAPGGLKPSLGGYHAWQSKDMVHWVHHGSVTDGVARWVTTAEQVGDKTYIYYDHPNDQDPHFDIGFAGGKFHLITQTSNDYVSPGPWVESVEARAGVDTTGDGVIDTWTGWQAVKESYDCIKGFSKQIQRTPAELDLSGLPSAEGFGFELRIKDTTANPSVPVLDSVVISYE